MKIVERDFSRSSSNSGTYQVEFGHLLLFTAASTVNDSHIVSHKIYMTTNFFFNFCQEKSKKDR